MQSQRQRAACIALTAAAALAVLPVDVAAQAASPAGSSSAATYLERYTEITGLTPAVGRVADVTHLVITRDAGQLILERGKLILLSPVGGRTVGAIFRGEGRFTFAPPYPAEQGELQRFAGSATLDDPFGEAILLFSDSTFEQLRSLTFALADMPAGLSDHLHDFIGSLKGMKDNTFSPDAMGPLLNGETSGYFLAFVNRNRGGDVLFQVNPALAEAVQLFKSVSRRQWGSSWAVVSQFPPARPLPGSGESWRYRERLTVPSYRVDVQLTESFNANITLSASATIAMVAREPVGPWLLFGLDPKLDVDSARWGNGERAVFFKADDDDALWVRAGRRLERGDSLGLTVFYHGDLIDRFGNFFFIDPGAEWYPTNGQGRSFASFDLTFRAPKRYRLISIGEPGDSSITGNMQTTHWVTQRPTSAASFNLGLFETWHVQHPGAPPLAIFLSEDAHRLLREQYAAAGYQLTEQAHMRENVAADISNSLKFFAFVFGNSSFERFTVSEIPYAEGVSFPGMIDLSYSTFSNTSLDGFDEFFRAHEAAHQWWGNGVRPGTYRDAWLSEGLATFCGLWYLQLARRHDDEYYRFLDQYRADIAADQDVGPIWIGYRNSSPSVRRGYDVMTYEKGAWVFNMLRVMMTDLNTLRADRFTEMMRNFYETFNGKPATTDDFRGAVELAVGIPMDWFFDQWVKGTAVPTYHVAWNGEPADNGRFRVRLRITQEDVPAEFHMPVLVAVDLGNQRTARFRVQVNGNQREYLSPLLPSQPLSLEFNAMHSTLADVKMERW
jgi:hypothetical protein